MLRLQPSLESALGKKMALPERKLQSIEEFITRFPSATKVMIESYPKKLFALKTESTKGTAL